MTLARASRSTPAIQTAQAALADAVAARSRECKGGLGRFCRERETAVNERRKALDAAMQSVGQTADPQTEAAIRIVGQLMGSYNPAPTTSQWSGFSCWRCCRRSAAYCSWLGDQQLDGLAAPAAMRARRSTETADYLTAPPVMPLMKRSKKRL